MIQDKNPVSIRESDTKKEEGVRRERVPEREREEPREMKRVRENSTLNKKELGWWFRGYSRGQFSNHTIKTNTLLLQNS